MGELTEKEAERILEKNGFKIANSEFIKKIKDLDKVKIKFPFVMKVSSKKIAHKEKVGGVIKNITNLEEAKKAFLKLSKIQYFEEALIQEQIQGQEIILGIKNTPEFSKVIMIGKGGTNVEKEKDISFRILPLKEKDIIESLKELKFYSELKKNKTNIKEIVKTAIKLTKLTKKYQNIQELDINPLIVNKKEAIVVDARISLKSK